MTWGYRIVKPKDSNEYSLREVYYNANGEPYGMTEDAISFGGDTPGDVLWALRMAVKDAANTTVLEEPETWAAMDAEP